MALSSWETLTSEERRRHPAYNEGYILFKGKPITFSSHNPYNYKETKTSALDRVLWNRGATAALNEDRGRTWGPDDGPPLGSTHEPVQLDLFG